MNTSIYLETLGCAKNRVDSEIMLATLLNSSFEYEPEPEKAEVIIVNTCAFLTSAVQEGVDRILALSELKKSGKCKKLIIAGCMGERYRESLLDELPEIDGLIGTSDYTEILPCIRNALEKDERLGYFQERPLNKKPVYSDNNSISDRILSTKQHYSYLKISEGCSNMCSFCNIPKLRGLFKSRPIEHIQKELFTLLHKGVKEINLISQDSSSYGMDLEQQLNLFDLTSKLLENKNQDFWLRIFYAYPNRFPLEIFDLMSKDKRLVNYIDMPFQHFSNNVLKTMNRKINNDKIIEIIEYAKNKVPDISFRTTFIVGFPTETENDFSDLLSFVEKGYFEHFGAFTYSHEDNIVSQRYGDPIPEEEKIKRKDLLMEAQKKILHEKNKKKIGEKLKILVEGTSDETDLLLQGRSQYQGVDVDGLVYINEGEAIPGNFYDVQITEAHPYDLVGKII